MSKYAYITLLCTNNYLYGCIGLYYSGKNTNPQYPFYVLVTPDITEENRRILREIGFKVIEDELYLPNSYMETLKRIENKELDLKHGYSTADLSKNGWQFCGTKFQLFKLTMFDKLLFLDADSMVLQNLDDIFERPEGSSIPEPWCYENQRYRFAPSFLLLRPDLQVYDELKAGAEKNPIIVHPATGEPQLSNDYDLLNLYKNDWGSHTELHIPQYVYADSLFLELNKRNEHYGINNFYKLRAIHLSNMKPGLGGRHFTNVRRDTGDLWRALYLWYIDFLNECLYNIHNKGIADLPPVN